MAETVTRRLKIINDKGLHARASARFVEVVEAHDARARVSRDGMDTEGDSIMGLLMLAASYGTTIDVETSGADASGLMTALEALVADKFGEES
ncbi:HPr family phosphocarrier protein [Sinisalibacter aestuarii]|uniref:HPr kinase n=1 Tax=Sinisalibacter aestuarii TaxID=2949426 RepID=A0ABQ5LWA4_9RHOB|nr:HPr family phosphocarrier protein [Sinisalibacter aestuarii]GKY89267.1 HPr kinase [Sinisalibacter aestuarii]